MLHKIPLADFLVSARGKLCALVTADKRREEMRYRLTAMIFLGVALQTVASQTVGSLRECGLRRIRIWYKKTAGSG